MFSNFKYIFLTFLIFFIFPQKVNAEVVINEINASEEWVELYKSTTEALSLDGCTIYFQDTKSQDKPLTASDNFLEGENYKVIFTNSTNGFLNNSSSDTVSLECSGFSIEPVTYGNNIETKSYARIPNGTGSFLMTTQITRGTQNPDPTPVPTPSLSPTPTNTPTVTATQTSVPTAVPTPKPTPTKTTTPRPTSIPTTSTEPEQTNNPENLTIPQLNGQTSTLIGMVAGINTEKKLPVLAIILIILGIGCLGYGGYLLYNMKHGRENKSNEIN